MQRLFIYIIKLISFSGIGFILFTCDKAICPEPFEQPKLYVYDSLDQDNCGCRILTVLVKNLDDYTIKWNTSNGDVLAENTSNIQVCPNTYTSYEVVVSKKNYPDFRSRITVGSVSECDKKQPTVCTKVLIETVNDLLQLHHQVSASSSLDLSSVLLSNSAQYDGMCFPVDTNYGSAKLNGVYRFLGSSSNHFYKATPLPVTCSFTANTEEKDSLKAPLPYDFINGTPAYLTAGEKVFANIIGPMPGQDGLFTILWTGVGSGYAFLGVCPPKKDFIINVSNSIMIHELYYFYFFTVKEGCNFSDAFNTSNCKNIVRYSTIKRVFNPRVDGNFCDASLPSNYDFSSKNIKVTLELIDGSYMDAFLGEGYNGVPTYDGISYFKYKEDRTNYFCP